jgi:hypothetical protein
LTKRDQEAQAFVRQTGLGELIMDFLETIFGFSPDGGNGMFEMMLFLIPILGLLFLAWQRGRKRKHLDD